jgi:DNA invertase Pin-like site-specific DNA recombinase
MDKAVIYSRVSTQDQDYQRQIDELKRYAEYQNYEVVGTFAEKVSGTIKGKHREEFTRMQEFVLYNEVKHVLVWELSRLGRKMVDVTNNVNEFAEKGVNVYSKKDNLNSLGRDGKLDPMTMIILGVLSGFSELERETTIERSKSGLDRHIRNGGAKSIPPLGFKSVNKKLVRDEEEGKIVMEIFRLYQKKKYGTEKIAKELNNRGIKPKINDYWVGGSILHVLRNPIYYGKRRHRDELIDINPDSENGIIPYISEERWNAIQQLIDERANKKTASFKNVNILNGLLKCGKCNKSMFLHRNNKNNVYVCLGKYKSHIPEGKEACNCRDVNIDNLNSLVFHALNEVGTWDIEKKSAEEWRRRYDETKLENEYSQANIRTWKKQLERVKKMYIVKGEISKGDFEKYTEELNILIQREVDKIHFREDEFMAFNRAGKKRKLGQPYSGNDIVFSTDGGLFKNQIQNVVSRIYIYNEPFMGKDEKEELEKELKRARRKAKKELEANPPVVEDMDAEPECDQEDFSMVELLKKDYIEDRTKSAYNTHHYKALFPNKQSYPTLVTIKLVDGKEYNYILPSLYRKYIDGDSLKVKDLTADIEI